MAESVFQPAGADRNLFGKAQDPAFEPADQQRAGSDRQADSGKRVERQPLAQRFAHGEERDPHLLLAFENIQRQV
ncbi:hypothetical protein SDC9_171113 [bioreactor metagenome]|uniref:Uncharacterized protein n=1 Tax=bioreactor metagenome TaxID=1076179 RepID=A0A645GCC1_9ZZZZ